MSKSFNVTLSDEAAAALQSVTTERKKGEWLSDLIMSRGSAEGEGVLERMESRLARIESLLAVLVVERQQNSA